MLNFAGCLGIAFVNLLSENKINDYHDDDDYDEDGDNIGFHIHT